MDRKDRPEDRPRRTFEGANRPEDAQGLKSAAQWEDYNKVTKRAEAARAQAERLHKERFSTRVARETKKLMASGGAKTRDLKYSLGSSDRFNPAYLRADAERIVQLRHAQRLSRIDVAEASTKFQLSKKAIDQALKQAQDRMRSQWRQASRGLSR